MAQQADKKDERSQGTPPNTSESNVDPIPSKDPDLYDPVGMAGKKAGIVEKIEEDLGDTPAEGGQGAAEKKR
jgi:hypothetical protein